VLIRDGGLFRRSRGASVGGAGPFLSGADAALGALVNRLQLGAGVLDLG
jgi:hypothetical protein